MEFNSAGLEILKEFEGCSLVSYQDQGGIWSIGYGCTHHVTPGMTITQEEAISRLEMDIQSTCDVVRNQLKSSPLNDNQFSAVACLAYNIGTGRFGTSTLLACLWAKHYEDAANQFLVWNKVNGAPNDGLKRRREAERNLFLKPLLVSAAP